MNKSEQIFETVACLLESNNNELYMVHKHTKQFDPKIHNKHSMPRLFIKTHSFGLAKRLAEKNHKQTGFTPRVSVVSKDTDEKGFHTVHNTYEKTDGTWKENYHINPTIHQNEMD